MGLWTWMLTWMGTKVCRQMINPRQGAPPEEGKSKRRSGSRILMTKKMLELEKRRSINGEGEEVARCKRLRRWRILRRWLRVCWIEDEAVRQEANIRADR